MKAGAIIFTKNKQNVVIVRNKTNKKWGFPKGHGNPGETIYDCAFREVYEETGIDLLKTKCVLYNYVNLSGYYYIPIILQEDVKFNIKDYEEIDMVKMTNIGNIPSFYTNRSIKDFYNKYNNRVNCLTHVNNLYF
jgi:8-oxo-dGTP pyrophosphatase MutT (NUDIX family)